MKVIRKVSMKNKDMGEERIFYKGWSYMAWVKERYLNRCLSGKWIISEKILIMRIPGRGISYGKGTKADVGWF